MKTVRCAIYTRKSSEEGLELSFNSLHAQRESCEAYILSQAGEGWTCLTTQYDDGGISGGHMQRPGLKALLADIKADKVDVIVVYKVDRLTRSLTDFSKLVEVFDSHEVSFVSVTQAFNTTNSMGRLTLNVLLSFAQFEREVTGERIRDKIALSRKRGLWTGGLPPLGYNAIEKKLVVNAAEATAVKHIYQRYAELKNVRRLQSELRRAGYVSKRRTTKTGRRTGGVPFERGALYTILKNHTYLGLTTHKGEAFDGEHDAIIDKALFDEVQSILSNNRRRDKHKSGAKNPSLLAGKIIAPSDIVLTPSHAQTKGRRYRYYVERRKDSVSTTTQRPVRLPAAEIEASVRSTLAEYLRDPIRLPDSMGLSGFPQDVLDSIINKASALADRINAVTLTPREMEIIRSAVKAIKLEKEAAGYRLHIDIYALAGFLEINAIKGLADPEIEVTLKLLTCNNGKKVILGNSTPLTPLPMPALINALRLAHQIKGEYLSSRRRSLSEIAKSLNIDKRQVWRTLKLAFLAPDIQLAILSGTQPHGLCVQDIPDAQVRVDWNDQRAALGFA